MKYFIILQLLFLFLFLFAVSSSYSQGKYPFPNKDGEWVVREMSPGLPWEYKVFVEKDTIINNLAYSILKVDKRYVRAAVRSDSTKVYAVNINDVPDEVNWPFDSTEYVLYDYGLRVGDHFSMVNYYDYNWEPIDTVDFEVTSVDYISVKGDQRKRIGLSKSLNYQYWIEGIGSTISPLYPAFLTEFEVGYQLDCYRENGKNIYNACGLDAVNSLQNQVESSFNSNEKILLLNAEGHLPITVTIFNSKGSLVCTSIESPQGQLDLSFLSKGCFIIHLLCGKNSYSQKIIINE